MNELFREIEDDIRREKLDRLWLHLGKIMVGVSVSVVLATIAIVMVQNHKQAVAMEQTGRLIKGLDRSSLEDYKGAVAALAPLADDASSSYYGIAMLRKAQAQNAGDDKEGATKTYQALATQESIFGNLAEMHINRPIEPDRKSPFYYTQSEWKGWQLMSAGKKDEAVAQFAALRDDAEAPFSMRQRMQEALQTIAPEKAAEPKVVVHE